LHLADSLLAGHSLSKEKSFKISTSSLEVEPSHRTPSKVPNLTLVSLPTEKLTISSKMQVLSCHPPSLHVVPNLFAAALSLSELRAESGSPPNEADARAQAQSFAALLACSGSPLH
jgi:hypothetical protein